MEFTDWVEILQLKYAYSYAVDAGDYEAWAAMFTEDGRFVHGNSDPMVGRDAIARYGREEIDQTVETMTHVPLNPIIDVNGTMATGRWYLMTIFRTPGGVVDWQQAKYDDTYRKVNGEWLIAESVLTPGIGHPDA